MTHPEELRENPFSIEITGIETDLDAVLGYYTTLRQLQNHFPSPELTRQMRELSGVLNDDFEIDQEELDEMFSDEDVTSLERTLLEQAKPVD